VDEATSSEAAMANIALIETYLDLIYPVAVDVSTKSSPAPASSDLKSQIDTLLSPLPAATRSAFTLLATLPIPRAPLDELLTGFKTDLNFSNKETSVLPIKTDADLFLYSQNVASSVAELCVRLVWANDGFGTASTELEREEVIRAAREMGVALQLVNICRDVPADRLLGRSYLPGFSLAASAKETTVKRRRLLCLARKMALESGPKIDRLPLSARGGIRAACKVYLEIGNEVEKALDAGDIECRARVSGLKRISVAWKAIGEYSWTGN
jgi:15-cis-phytoene synthase/lycopene beta-cyclase